MLLAKYDVPRDGWAFKEPFPRHSTFWKGILLAKESFMKNIKFKVSSREMIFWLEPWIGNSPLVMQFPNLFNCAKVKVSNSNE